MRSRTTQLQLEAKVLMQLRAMRRPQTLKEIAEGLSLTIFEVNPALHALVESQQALRFDFQAGPVYEPAHGGYDPEPRGAA